MSQQVDYNCIQFNWNVITSWQEKKEKGPTGGWKVGNLKYKFREKRTVPEKSNFPS